MQTLLDLSMSSQVGSITCEWTCATGGMGRRRLCKVFATLLNVVPESEAKKQVALLKEEIDD
jgi:hypothetical protein